MVAGAKQLAEKIVAQSAKDTVLKFRVTNGARHTTAFSTTLSFKLRAFLHPSYKERT
ncbi:hypothetical protein GARC_4347 [Paraglaciecola arctica BSs20135]|uniref:Uncharacterized protein n=2 Tax=Paraglaciecola TaxID=1621534 RepID=K6XKY3_9ALTE|nr:hypothetical protein GARC_4347 [Paraglaciecola arctica BSs20135]